MSDIVEAYKKYGGIRYKEFNKSITVKRCVIWYDTSEFAKEDVKHLNTLLIRYWDRFFKTIIDDKDNMLNGGLALFEDETFNDYMDYDSFKDLEDEEIFKVLDVFVSKSGNEFWFMIENPWDEEHCIKIMISDESYGLWG